jgi:hypothetical protein
MAATLLLAPPLAGDLHKGQAGRVGVLGGSVEYVCPPTHVYIHAPVAHVLWLQVHWRALLCRHERPAAGASLCSGPSTRWRCH